MATKKPSKYAGVVGNLSALPPEDPAAQARIDEIKQEIRAEATHTPETLARAYMLARMGEGPDFGPAEAKTVLAPIVARLGRDGLKDLLSEVNKRVTAYEQLIVDSHDSDEAGWGTHGAAPNAIRLPSGSTVSVQLEPTGKVEDKEAFRLWCVANGYEKSLQLWPSTMNAMVKKMLLDGEKEPDGVKAYILPKVVLRS